MGWIQELADLFGKLSFFDIVYEYQQGLLFNKGICQDVFIRRSKKELEEIVAEERKVIHDSGGYIDLVFRRKKPIFPEGYRRNNITGLPRHQKRFKTDKVLRPGLYFHLPIVEDIKIYSKQEKVLSLENISVPTTEADSRAVVISCNIRYELLNFYKAFTAVHDYERSLRDYTLAILAKFSRGKTYEDWKKPETIEKLEDDVLRDVRKLVTDKWGLTVHKIYITDNVACTIQKVLYEGKPLLPSGESIQAVE